MPETDKMRRLRQLSRQRMRLIWEIASLDETSLSNEERLLVNIMRLHPEYYDLWERLDEVTEAELERDKTNPVLHVTIHQIIENQIATNHPPETAQTLERLLEKGLSRHEAIHEIGSVLARDIAEIMKSNRNFSEQKYIRRLRQLVKPRRQKRRRLF
ncbi:MAG: DUF1841 family protein [Anaerolineae bacterium]|nr:DUF1841 family protein [Anaerolineae bacterium]